MVLQAGRHHRNQPAWPSKWSVAAVGANGMVAARMGRTPDLRGQGAGEGHRDQGRGLGMWMLQAPPSVLHIPLSEAGQQLVSMRPVHDCLPAAPWSCWTKCCKADGFAS